MTDYELYSKRAKADDGTVDVYTYDSVPRGLRVQTVFIWDKLFPDYADRNFKTRFYNKVRDVVCEELGLTELKKIAFRMESSKEHELKEFFLDLATSINALDIIQVSFQVLRDLKKGSGQGSYGWDRTLSHSVIKLNGRFREHAVGYEIENFLIVRVDSQFVHSNVVRPVFKLLNKPGYEGPEKEFYEAHEHLRAGRSEEAMVAAIKSMESTLKCIFEQQGWQYNSSDSFRNLLAVAFDKGLLPSYSQSHFSGLRACLEGGAPTARNKSAGHGQGSEIRDVPDHIAAFTIHSAAAAIILFVESSGALQ